MQVQPHNCGFPVPHSPHAYPVVGLYAPLNVIMVSCTGMQ